MHPLILLLLAIVSETVGTLALKMAQGFTRPVPSILVVLGYGAAFYLLSLTLDKIAISTAYAIWAGVGTAAVTVLGVLLFRESLNWAGIVGIALIISGVVLLNLYGSAHA